MQQVLEFVRERGWEGFVLLRAAMDWLGTGFLVLYAAFGIAEVVHRLPKAIAGVRRNKATVRHVRAVLTRFAAVLISLGPLYISIEAWDRLRGIALH